MSRASGNKANSLRPFHLYITQVRRVLWAADRYSQSSVMARISSIDMWTFKKTFLIAIFLAVLFSFHIVGAQEPTPTGTPSASPTPSTAADLINAVNDLRLSY